MPGLKHCDDPVPEECYSFIVTDSTIVHQQSNYFNLNHFFIYWDFYLAFINNLVLRQSQADSHTFIPTYRPPLPVI